MDLSHRRESYEKQTLSESQVASDPFIQFDDWYTAAESAKLYDANAMTLATSTADGLPSARIVLLKAYSDLGFDFYTNYESQKGQELLANPHAALLFFWPELQRQIRIVGTVTKLSAEESFAYFSVRPYESKIGAWSSPQSQIIASRKLLEDNIEKYKILYPDEVPLPPFWGGYRVVPSRFEFWQGRRNRLHDRLIYVLENGNWNLKRLAS